jgi:hypothetical protein
MFIKSKTDRYSRHEITDLIFEIHDLDLECKLDFFFFILSTISEEIAKKIPLQCYRTLHCGHCRMTLEGLPILYKARFEPPKCSRNRVDPERNDAGAAPVFSLHCPCSIHNQKCNNLYLVHLTSKQRLFSTISTFVQG